MQGYGGGRVIRSLISFPCEFNTKSMILALPSILDGMIKESRYREYMGNCAMDMVNNLASAFGGVTIETNIEDWINPKPIDTRSNEEIVDDILEELKDKGLRFI